MPRKANKISWRSVYTNSLVPSSKKPPEDESRSRLSPASSTAQQPYSCQPSYQPPESHLAVTVEQVGDGPDRRGQESRLDADFVRVAAADGILGLDAYLVDPETDKAAPLT